MKKQYDSVVIGGGVAGYLLAALASTQGHVLFFESEQEPTDPPWTSPILPDAPGSAWHRVREALSPAGLAPGRFRFQRLNGRERDDGFETPPPEPFPFAEWLTAELAVPRWFDVVRGWFASPPPGPALAPTWMRLTTGVEPAQSAVRRYLAATAADWSAPAGELVDLLRVLRERAAREGTEFLPAGRLDAVIPGEGVRVEGLGATLRSARMAVCVDVGEWSRIPGLGALPRKVLRRVRQNGVRVRATWTCAAEELPVGLAGRGWWADEPQAWYDVTEGGGRATLRAWTMAPSGPDVDAPAVAAAMHAVVRRYAPFFSPKAEEAQVLATPVYGSIHRKGLGVPAELAAGYGYAGPQSYPGWGAEGEMVAALRVNRRWYPPESPAA